MANAQGDDSCAAPKLAVFDVTLHRLLNDLIIQLLERALDGSEDLVARRLLGRPKDGRLTAGRHWRSVHKDEILSFDSDYLTTEIYTLHYTTSDVIAQP